VKHFSDPGFRTVFRQAHNVVLNYAMQIGIPGALALLLLFGALAWTFWCNRANGADARIAATCGLILVVGVFTRNMTDDFFGRHGVLLFGALCGLLLALSEQRATSPTR
jgi:O-antigen ligase